MPDDEDIYVAEQNKGTAMHNDKVRVRVVPSNYTSINEKASSLMLLNELMKL